MERAFFIPRKPSLGLLKKIGKFLFSLIVPSLVLLCGVELFISNELLKVIQKSSDKIVGKNYHLIKADKFQKVFVEITPKNTILRLPFPFYPLAAKVNNESVLVYVFEKDVEEDPRLLEGLPYKRELFLFQGSNPTVYFSKDAEGIRESMSDLTLATVFVQQIKFLIQAILPSSRSHQEQNQDSIDGMIFPLFFGFIILIVFGLFRESKNEIKKRCQQIDEFKNELIEWESCSEVTVESVSGRFFTSKAMKNIHKDFKVKKIFFIPVKYYLYLKWVGNPAIIVDGPEELIGKLVPINYRGKFKRMVGRAISVDGLIYFVTKPTILN
ncbi:MAG: hypothetical protein K2P81_08075 [Bacteriovoracaceae bacterium]|nr:hypothetical protein [Bacteriovoracaceae bacterium]